MAAFMNVMRTLLRWATSLSFIVLIVAVTIQVVSRSFLGSSPVWTEELTRFALLYLAGFGTALSLWSGDLVNVNLLSDALPGRGPWICRLLSAIAVAGFCAMLIWPAWRFTAIGKIQSSPAMGVPMSWVHASVLVLLVMLGIAAAVRIIAMLTGASDGQPEFQTGEIE